MRQAIRDVVVSIPRGYVFDSQYIVAILLVQYAELELEDNPQNGKQSELSEKLHQQVCSVVGAMENELVDLEPEENWSKPVRDHTSKPIYWRKR